MDARVQRTADRTVDVLVVGGGAAGVAATVAAARNGADTLLVERAGFLGGISATLPWLGFHDQRYQQVVKGLPLEFVRRLQAVGGAGPITLDPKCGSLVAVHPHLWKIVSLQLVREAGAHVMFHTLVTEALRDGDRITGVVVETKSGRERIHARTVIDCSGDGDVAAMAGAGWEKGRTADGLVQAPTLVFRLGGVDDAAFKRACQDPTSGYREWFAPYPDLFAQMAAKLDEVDTYVLGGFAKLIERAREAGDADFPQTRIVGVKVSTPNSPQEISVVMTRVLGLDPTDVDLMTEAYTRVYDQIPRLVSFFRKWVPGCEHAYLVEIAPMLGVRESRRIVGDYVLPAEDLVTGARHPDDVAMGGYHIDIHRPSGSWVESYNVQAYGIPLRSLVAAGVDGLMMAGKCLSATHEAVASTRVIPICMAQGQAAGTAAALAARDGVSVREVDAEALRAVLVEQGAEIGTTLTPPDPEEIDGWPLLPQEAEQTTGERDTATTGEAAWVR
ncbi:MAG: FAD-dependent oxidoreductase [Microbacterium sp.]|nr:FAD-dependent oxidoreductase [Microbacterium sp.]